jgi:hypothetical protein
MLTFFRMAALGLATLHLARGLLPFDLELAISLFAVAVFVPGLFMMGKGFRKVSLIFLVAGMALLLTTSQPAAAWIKAWNSMTNVIAILVAMQAFGIPVSMGAYDKVIQRWTAVTFKSARSLYLFSSVFTHVIGSFLMFGALPVALSLLGSTIEARSTQPKRFIATLITRSYVMIALWAPGAINLFLIIQATGVTLSAMLPPGLILATLGLLLSWGMEQLHGGVLDHGDATGAMAAAPAAGSDNGDSARDFRNKHDNPRSILAADRNSLLVIILVACCMVGLVLLFERLGIGLTYTRILLAACLVISIWTLSLLRHGDLSKAVTEYWVKSLPKVSDMGPFFVSMGFFSGALEVSGLIALVQPFIQQAALSLGMFSLVILPLLLIILSLVGMHPFITIVLLGKILADAGLPFPTTTIALVMAVGGATAYMISPFGGIVMSMSAYTGVRAADVAIRWNWKFCLVFFAFGVSFALLWGRLFF